MHKHKKTQQKSLIVLCVSLALLTFVFLFKTLFLGFFLSLIATVCALFFTATWFAENA